MKKMCRRFVLGALLAGVMLCLSSYSSQAAIQPVFSPDQVQISIISIDAHIARPKLVLADQAQVKSLYRLIQVLPVLPANAFCTLEIGLTYRLVFQQNKQQVTMTAERFGCKPITTGTQKRPRRTNAMFWRQLDQAILHATPIP
ncbi:hypothetical protein KDA_41370 [Dictyobacter alpinus]|uniref:Uncharacterized protein n=1 Tax=Dictyobacter alpinus TaxID=2014873 RepID=A0A402BB77_9CHLR|nr:hypothetical protein [Dictyobacter alpinus]GCE28653.1 hypothetical protein KDA_41370 [Dictyobacter alpinus]